MFSDWKFWATIIAAVVGAVVPIVLWQYDNNSKSLTLRAISSIALEPANTTFDDVAMTVGGIKIKNPYLSTIEFSNTGSKPISAVDFEGPVEFIAKGASIERVRVASSEPSGIPGALALVDGRARLQPLLLNPRDTLTMAFVTAGERPQFEVAGRVSGIKKIESIEVSLPSSRAKIAYKLSIAAICILLYAIFAVNFFWPLNLPLERWLILATAFVFCLLGNLAVADLTSGQIIPIDFPNASIAIGTVCVLILPAFVYIKRRFRRANLTMGPPRIR